MKIVLCSFYPVFSGTGGAEKVFWLMANELSRRGHDVTAVGFEKNNTKPFFSVSENVHIENAGIKYNKSTIINLKALFCHNAKSRRVYRDFEEGKRKASLILPILNKVSPDIIVSYQIEMTYILTEILNVPYPVVTMCHNSIDYLLDGKERFYVALEKCDCIQVLLNSYVKRLNNYLNPQRVEYIPNIVYQCTECAEYKNKVIINVGRIDREQKRQDLLIKAFAKISHNYPDWSVEFWGDTSNDKEYFLQCCKLIQKYKLQDKVKFCGTTKNIKEKLKKASIFAFPSEFEGFPLALTEAMSMGLPSVGYKNCTGTNELIKNEENGFLVENGVDSFSEALEQLMKEENKRKQLGKNAKNDMKQYSPRIVWDKWESLIYEIVSDRKRDKNE